MFETLPFCLSSALQCLSEATETRAGPPSSLSPAPPGPRGSQVAGVLLGVPQKPAFCICLGADWRALRKPSGQG